MKSKEEFNQYYEKELKPIVASLEAKRLGIADRFSYKRYKRNLLILLVVDVVVGILVSNTIIPQAFIGIIPGSLVYAMFAPLYIFIRRNWSFDPINEEYKKSVIPKIISFLDSQLAYKPKEGISQREFNDSDLFGRPTSSFQAEDLVEGRIDEFPVRLSDVDARQRSSGKDSSGKSSGSSSSTLMNGLYAVVKIPQKVPSRVIIQQSNIINNAVNQFAQQILGSSLTEALRDNMHQRIIKTGHHDFDKDFEVVCADESVALQLLNPMLRQMLMAIKAEMDPFVFIKVAVFDDQLHIAYNGVTLFEGDAHRSFFDNDISKKYFFYMTSVVGLAKAMQ